MRVAMALSAVLYGKRTHRFVTWPCASRALHTAVGALCTGCDFVHALCTLPHGARTLLAIERLQAHALLCGRRRQPLPHAMLLQLEL